MDDVVSRLVGYLTAWAKGLGQASIPLLVPRARPELPRTASGHFHLRSELFLQLSGSTEFLFPRQSYRLDAGHALLLPPRLHHGETAVSSAADPFLNLVLIFEGSTLFLHSAVAGAANRPQIDKPIQQANDQYLPVARWLEEAAAAGETSPEVAVNLVAAVLASCARLLARNASDRIREPLLVATARSLVRNSLGDASLSVASLAGQLACTPDYLSHRFSVATGTRLVEWIGQLRLERAAELLTQTRLSSKETAWACGFVNQSYFIRLFRNRFGLSPLEYRRQTL